MIKPTREDERKIFEAYRTIDRLINGHDVVNDAIREETQKLGEEIKKLVMDVIRAAYAIKSFAEFAKLEFEVQEILENIINKYIGAMKK